MIIHLKLTIDNNYIFVNNFQHNCHFFICKNWQNMTIKFEEAKILRFLIFTLIFFLNFCVGECRNFVFVASSSQSMNFSDPAHRVAESIAWAVENIPADDEVGIIYFNNTSHIQKNLSKNSSAQNTNLNTNYSGLSNAGDAMITAVDMLTQKFDEEKSIIFIGNGEILCENSARTLQSEDNFINALNQAKWQNISVYILNLRYNGDPKNFRSFSNYAKEIPIPHTELFTTLRTILHNDFNTPHLNLFEKIHNEKTLSVEIPVIATDDLKLFLISSNAGKADSTNAEKKFDGNFVKTFEIHHQTAENFNLNLNFPAQTAITLDAIAEVEGTLQKDIFFNELELILRNLDGTKILSDKFFEDKPIRAKINGKIFDAKISDGEIKIDLSDEDKNISLQKVYFEDVGIIFKGDDTAELVLSDHRYLPYILAGLAILAILLLALRKRKVVEKTKEVSQEKISVLPRPVPEKTPPVKVEPVEIRKRVSYNGKFIIYFTRHAGVEEIEPREFNLFRETTDKINLQEILKKCEVEEEFLGAENIFISPSKKGIFLINDSDCTILKRNNLVEKGRQTELFYNDSISISSENESSEFIMMYKSLKPS